MNPCTLRPANGMQCAREFGITHALTTGELPDYETVMKHIKGYNFSSMHRKNLWYAARNAAKEKLDNHPLNLAKLKLEAELNSLKEKLASIKVSPKSKYYQAINSLTETTHQVH